MSTDCFFIPMKATPGETGKYVAHRNADGQELSGHAISMIVPAKEKCDLHDAQNGHAVSSVKAIRALAHWNHLQLYEVHHNSGKETAQRGQQRRLAG